MAQMSFLAYYGGVSPLDYVQMDYLEAQELTTRLLRMKRDEDEAAYRFAAEMTKAIMKSNGARF